MSTLHLHLPVPMPSAPEVLNPYYAAWLRLTGGGANWEYMAWNQRAWSAFEREAGIDRRERGLHRAEFAEWLAARTEGADL